MLNDPVFVEAARVFAEHTAAQPGDPSARLAWASRRALGPDIAPDEAAILTDVYETQLARYQPDSGGAQQLLKTGQHPLADDANPTELADGTQVTRAILNAYETASRY